MAASTNSGSIVGILIIRALPFGLHQSGSLFFRNSHVGLKNYLRALGLELVFGRFEVGKRGWYKVGLRFVQGCQDHFEVYLMYLILLKHETMILAILEAPTALDTPTQRLDASAEMTGALGTCRGRPSVHEASEVEKHYLHF